MVSLRYGLLMVGMAIPVVGSTQGIARAMIPSVAQQSSQKPATPGLSARVSVDLDGVSFAQALAAVARQAALRITVTDDAGVVAKRVTLRVRDVSAGEAFRRVLQGTTVQMSTARDGEIIFSIPRGPVLRVQGTITGKVTDAATKRPIAGAMIQVEGTERGAQTDEEGRFRIADVPVGSRTVIVKRLGYTKVTRLVTIGEAGTAAMEIALEASASALDQIVVTGTIIQTELKAVPSAITVVTAKQLEERGITQINQLFRGDIPGLFAMNQGSNGLLDEVAMFSRGATALSGSSSGITGSSLGTQPILTNPIKTYIDGVEMADPKYISQIDPRSIERIEILTGPQASTIYGSNAINGVMQIFTKRGATSRPQLALTLMSGLVENSLSDARTPQHDYSGQLSGIEGRLSYSAGGAWNYMGPWTPAKKTTRMSGFGGARLEMPTTLGRVTADMTLQRAVTHNKQDGSEFQTQTGYRESGWWTNLSSSGLIQPTVNTVLGQTLGLTLSYAPLSWWSHEFGLGYNVSDADERRTARGYLSIDDTTLSWIQARTDRRSLRYATTTRMPITAVAQATVTAGADAWQSVASSWSVTPQTLTGSLTGTTTISRQPGHNTGGFLQTQLALRDRLFLTYGLRAEWNPDYGEEAQPNIAPRYGVAYTQEVGPITAKLRGSYGRSTRPPQSKLKVGQNVVESYGTSWSTIGPLIAPFYPNFDRLLANPDLGPERQQGGEGGIELYLGARGSLVVTRYNQTVDQLIAQPVVDSVRSLVPCPSTCAASSRDADGYGYRGQLQYLNLGSLRNQGWELQGHVNLGPLTTRGTYSWTKSRTIGVTPRYREFFNAFSYPQYQPGASFQGLPEHTWAFGVTYANGSSSVGLNIGGTGEALTSNNAFYLQNLDGRIRLPQLRLNMSSTDKYVHRNNAYALADLTSSHRFSQNVEGILQIQNLANHYTNDVYAAYTSIGRQGKFGFRVRM